MNKDVTFKRGDIVKNLYAGENNPGRYLLYIRKGTIRQGRFTSKSYDCIGFDGTIRQLFADDAKLLKVGHMDEFDAFMCALKSLNDIVEDQ